jgi:phosphate transport system ATP-binding protein
MQIDTNVNALGEVILRTEDVSVFYGSHVALKGVNLEIYKNKITGFIGPSGCGKSTLIRCFNRLNDLVKGAKVTGRIALAGQDIQKLNPVEVRRRVGMVFQRPNPFPKSVYENIAIGLRVNGYQGDIDELVEDSLHRVGLWDEIKTELNKNALTLSGGQQQLLCIARALALQPEILLLDEPCSSLDPISTSRIEDLLLQLKQHYTIAIVTHNLQQASRVTDMVAYFDIKTEADQRIGELVEYAPTPIIFCNPTEKTTWEYVGIGSCFSWNYLS